MKDAHSYLVKTIGRDSPILEAVKVLWRNHADMFGGYGLYYGEQFFGIVHDGCLYFKTNLDTLPEFDQYHAAVFAPAEKQVLKNYREVPADILEDRESLLFWARRAAR
jgi:DNA transformation protein and related proteins